MVKHGMNAVVACALTLCAAHVGAADWYPSRYGADDLIGAANNLSAEKVLAASKLIKHGKTYSLGVPTGPESPAYPPRRYSIIVIQPGMGASGYLGSNRATGNDDFLATYMGVGSQLDGLGHMGIEHVYYNGNKAEDFATSTGLRKLSTDKIPPLVTRGVLLDMVKLKGKRPTAGVAFNRADIDAAAAAAKVTIEKGDIVLLHTGWLDVADSDKARFMAGEPGLGVEGARYLASLGVVAVGADNWAVEVLPHEDPTQAFPVHVELLPRNGVYILENMDTRALAADAATEFLFVLGQPKFVGAVQAIINPIAIR